MTLSLRMLSSRTFDAIQYGSHWPCVAMQHSKCGRCDCGAEFLIFFNFSLNVPRGYCIGQPRGYCIGQHRFRENFIEVKKNS